MNAYKAEMPTRTAFLPDFRGPPMTTRRHPPGPPTATTCPKQKEDTRERTHQPDTTDLPIIIHPPHIILAL